LEKERIKDLADKERISQEEAAKAKLDAEKSVVVEESKDDDQKPD
jgi:hypothetical protein